MKNGFDEKVKGHGFFRKTKAFGLASGIALGAALLIGANTVSADEATPAQPTTTAQSTSSDTKTEVVTVKEAELKAKVDEAKKAGVEVIEKPAVSVGTATNDADAKKLEAEATKKVDAEIKALDDAKASVSVSSEAKKAVEDAKKEYLNNDTYGPSTSHSLLAYLQLNDQPAPSLKDVTNFKSSLGSPSFFTSSFTYYRDGSDAREKTFESLKNLVKAPLASTPTEIKFYTEKGSYFNPTEDTLKEYVAKRLNTKQDVYLLNLRNGEEVSWDINIPSSSVLNKYGVVKVHQTVKLDGDALPPEVYATEVVTPYLSESGLNHLLFDNSTAGRSGGLNFNYIKTISYLNDKGEVINPATLVAKYLNNEVFGGNQIINESDLKPEWFNKTKKWDDGKLGVGDNAATYKNNIDSLKNGVLTYQVTIVPPRVDGAETPGSYILPGYLVYKFSPLNKDVLEKLKNNSKVEVSPVTYTRATAITTTYVPNDKLNPGETKIIDDGKQSGKKVIEVGIKPSEKVEETLFKEETRPNPALPEGERKVVQEGVKGRKVTRTTYTLDTKTGKVTPKEEVTENTAAKNRIVEVGTKKPDSVTEGELVTVYRPNDKLEAGKQNEVDPGKKSKLVNGKETEAGKPRIIEVGTKPVVMEKEIPFKETVVQNPSKPEGTHTVLKEGKVGKETTTTTYALDTKTGKVTPDTKTTVVKAEDRLVEVGTGKNVTGDVETQYVPDPELEPGQSKVVQNGTPEVKDVTGKVLTPGKPTIIHIGTKPKVVEEELPFKEEVRENKDLPKGERKVVQEGKVGKKVTTTTYTLDPKTGKVTSTDKVEETAAVNKIIEVGTKEEVKATPAPQAPAAPKAQLPHTGTEASLALTLAGLAVAGIATTMVRKKKEQ